MIFSSTTKRQNCSSRKEFRATFYKKAYDQDVPGKYFQSRGMIFNKQNLNKSIFIQLF